MKKPSDSKPGQLNLGDTLQERLIGLGARSVKKTYYSELKQRNEEMERFRVLVDNAGDAIFVIEGGSGIISDVNKTALRLLGLSEGEVKGLEFQEFFPKDVHELVDGFVREKALTRTAVPIQTTLHTRAGAQVPVEFNLVLHTYLGLDYATVVMRDISRRKKVEEELRASRERFSSLFEQSPVSTQIFSAAGDQIQVNRAWLKLWGRKEPFPPGHYNLFRDKQLMEAPDTAAFIREVFGGGFPAPLEHVYDPKLSGFISSKRWLRTSSYPVFGENGEVRFVVIISEDITSDMAMKDRIQHMSLHDPLTGLGNRTLILERIGMALERVKGGPLFSLLYLNVDRFKVINDSLGHVCGDAVLREIARRLAGEVREVDTVARLGSDEFAVLLEDLPTLRMPVEVVKRIRRELSRPFLWRGKPLYLTASIGIALHPEQAKRAEDVVRNANIALHRAKERGGNRFKAFTMGLLNRAMTRMTLESDMEIGIRQGEFFLQYQPIFSMRHTTERLDGFEVLCRWNHPERGLVSPGDFIPIAEDTGKIFALGQFVLRKACERLAIWLRDLPKARNVVMSVNVSPSQLARTDFTEFVRETLARTGVPGKSLRLEVTETALMQSGDIVLRIMRELKELGVTFSVDDFGTGYSNMNYLTRLPLDSLKIDLSFVQRMDKEPEYRAVVKGVTDLAHSLGLKVVAEGVETMEQLEMLIEIGCECYQGYLFSRPLPDDEVAAQIKARA